MATDNQSDAEFAETSNAEVAPEEEFWEGWNASDVSQATEDASDDSGDFLKLADGDNVLRFLPALKGRPKYVKILQHFIPEIRGQKGFTAVCTMNTQGRCLVCAFAQELASSGNPIDEELAQQMKPKSRYLYSVSRRKADGAPSPAKLLGVAPTVHESLVRLQRDPTKGGDFTDPGPSGYDVIITKTGQRKSTEYEVSASRRSSPLSPDMATVRSIILGQIDPTPHTRALSQEELVRRLGPTASAAITAPSARLGTGTGGGTSAPRRIGDDLDNWKGPSRRGA